MADLELVQVSPSADEAFSAFDYAAQAPRDAIRIFVQGFG
jgi:hypothetical protein